MATTPANRPTASGSLYGTGNGGPRLRDWFSLAVFQRAASQLFTMPRIFSPRRSEEAKPALAFAALLLSGSILCGCAQYPATAKVCYERDGKTVCVGVADNAVQIHAASDTGISGDFTLPLKGYAK